VTEHPELLIQRYRTSSGRRLELPQNRRCEQYEMEEERRTGGENSVMHRPAEMR